MARSETMEGFLEKFRPGSGMTCPCGRPHEIKTRMVVVRSGAVEEIPEALAKLGLGGKVAVVFDTVVKPIAEAKVLPVLKRAGVAFETICVEGKPEVEADLATAGELMKRLPEDAGVLMSVGSGTINDLSKYSAAMRGLPYVSVATAASMNGYTSSITALMDGIFKTTQETEPAMVVIADVDILREAPALMTCAGLGDIVSKWVCNADWKLSNLVRKTYFCDVPFGLIKKQEKYYMDHAGELGKGDPAAIQALTEAIMISGFSMSIVGVSSPSSGSEHLISHTWEMKQVMESPEEKARLHGAQVGVATVLMARMYELVSELDPKSVNKERAAESYPDLAEVERRVKAYFGKIAPEVMEETRKKQLEPQDFELELEWVLGNWGRVWKQLKKYRRSSGELSAALKSAGAPWKPADLGFTRKQTLDAIIHARYMRSRYTVLDLAEMLGVLPELAEKVCEEYC